MSQNLRPTLVSTLWPAATPGTARLLRSLWLGIAGTLLLTISAKVQVPFYPVPLTLQTLVVLVLGAAFGWQLATATLVLYLAEGLIGLPVFAGSIAGPAYVAGPTGGFLVGFVVAAAFVGACMERGLDRGLGLLTLVMALGHAIIFAFGFGWLAMLIGPEKAWLGGVAPFALATAVKTLLAAALVPALWQMTRKLRGTGASGE